MVLITLGTFAGVAVGTTAAALVGPVVLPVIGFTSAGITGGSLAASAMSFAWTKGIGVITVSAMQSAGALGTIGAAKIAASGFIGGLVGSLL